MAQLRDTLIQGSARVTDTLYANNVNIASTTASLPLFTDTSKNIITKSIADTKTALGIAASANHADSYFVKAITSVDNKIVRFDGNAGQIQTGPITISDEGYIRSYNTTRWTIDWYIFHPGASKQVAELYFDSGDATNITGGTLYWRQYSPTSTNSNTPTSFHETYNLPTVTKGLTENKSYSIITTKNLSSITTVGTISSGTWQGTAINASYLPTATSSAKGIVQVGTGLGVSSGTISVTYGTSNGTALGTASAGSVNSAARSDHVHPLPALTSCTGTLTVAKGGTGVTSFTNDCVVVATGTTQTLVSRGLKVTGATNADITLAPNTAGKIMSLQLADATTITYDSSLHAIKFTVS